MNRSGFYIKKILISGENKKDTVVDFNLGLNVISGPSDTGKTYIFECINYMLGSSKLPKNINESKGYSSITMEISTYDQEIFTLKRTFGETSMKIYKVGSHLLENSDPYIIDVKHSRQNKDNLSAFLLDISGFKHPTYIKTKKSTLDTRTLSFRDMPMYVIIDEIQVMKTEPPIFSGQYSKQTVEKSVFMLMVSGIEDLELLKYEEKPLSKSKLESQKELLNRLIIQEEKKLLDFPEDTKLKSEVYEVHKIEFIKEQISNINKEINVFTDAKGLMWKGLEEDKSKEISLTKLLKRFSLLREQYLSDRERLEFIREGNHYFEQLNYSVCPLCKRNFEDVSCSEKHRENSLHLEGLYTEAIDAEINKISMHLEDLNSTIVETKIEQVEISEKIKETNRKIDVLNNSIIENLKPKEEQLNQLLEKYLYQQSSMESFKVSNQKVSDYKDELKLINKKLTSKVEKTEQEEDNVLVTDAIEDFCDFLSSVLKRWMFAAHVEVTFTKNRFYINSKNISDYGKGSRSIIYSAFAIAMMEYCKANRLPHPGFVILDSPLTTFKGKKRSLIDGEVRQEVKIDVQEAFFRDLIKMDKDSQIIILENKEPKEELKNQFNYIEFTKDTENGRYGLFQ